MARRRFFVPPLRHNTASLTGEDAHHLTRVLRVEAGQRYEIVSAGAVYLAEVEEARKSLVVFRAVESLPLHPLPVRIRLYFALIKFDRLELLLEKGTEAGAGTFVPLITDRSEHGLERAAGKRRPRWERILLESAQQSRRDTIPELLDPLRLKDVAASDGGAGARYLLDESREAPPMLSLLQTSRSPSGDTLPRIDLFLGPEGGWTGQERSMAAANGWVPVSVGPQVLRSETAAVVSISMVIGAWCAAAVPPLTSTM